MASQTVVNFWRFAFVLTGDNKRRDDLQSDKGLDVSKKRGKGKEGKKQRVSLRGEASEEAALRIEEVARGLRSGAIQLSGDAATVQAPAGSELSWKLEARQGKRKSRIEIDIRWRVPKSDGDDDDERDAEAETVTEAEADAAKPETSESPLENPSW